MVGRGQDIILAARKSRRAGNEEAMQNVSRLAPYGSDVRALPGGRAPLRTRAGSGQTDKVETGGEAKRKPQALIHPLNEGVD